MPVRLFAFEISLEFYVPPPTRLQLDWTACRGLCATGAVVCVWGHSVYDSCNVGLSAYLNIVGLVLVPHTFHVVGLHGRKVTLYGSQYMSISLV